MWSLFVFALLLLAAPFERALALGVTPIHIEMTAAGSGSRAQFTVNNDSKSPVPVEITIDSFELNEAGSSKVSKSPDEFLIFPPQAVIAPGASQTFRIQWVADPSLAKSRSYMVNVNQIPVKLPAGQSAVQIVMSFGVMVNVAPSKGTGNLKLVGTAIDVAKDGKRRPVIIVENSAAVHALLSESTLRASVGGKSVDFGSSEIREKIGIGLVQPGKRRKFVLPVDLPPNVTKVEATLEYKPKRN